jgi:hypothetical protein
MLRVHELADFAHLGFSMLPHVGVIVFTDGEPLVVFLAECLVSDAIARLARGCYPQWKP